MTTGRLRGRITGGRLERVSSPRIGILLPNTNSVTTMTRNGTASVSPCLAHSGHQDFVLERNCTSVCTTPRARAPISAAHSELSRAISAAARAGTTSSVRLPGERTPVAGPATIRMNAVNTVDRIHVTRPRTCGESRANDAARSFSDAAWIASPVLDHRNQKARMQPRTTVMPINHRRSTATLAPPISTVPSGNITSRLRGSVPYFKLMAACSVSMMPTAATTLASTGAVRSGLETATCTRAPNPAATKSATKTDTHVGGGPTSHDGSHGIGRRSSPSWRKLKT